MGRTLGAEMVDRIREQTRISFELLPLAASDEDPLPAGALERLAAAPDAVEWVLGDDRREAFALLRDLGDVPVLALHATLDREISSRGAFAARVALGATVLGTLVLLLVLYVLLERTVVRPLQRLTALTVQVGETDALALKVAQDRDDEIGVLSREFESMMRKLDLSRADLLTASRRAGMSEVATSVLHNVGNLLNSVQVSGALMNKELRSLPIEDLGRVAGMLEAQGDRLGLWIEADPRGKKLPAFLNALAADLDQHVQGLQTESRSLMEGLENVRALIRGQQQMARSDDVAETFDLRGLLEKAVKASKLAQGTAQSIDVRIDCVIEEPVQHYRHRILNVLVNLMNNAQEALLPYEREAKRVTVRARESAGTRLVIEVEDNGPGIARADQVRIFHYGVTTKTDGHGFGLHGSANDAKEMGGRLELQSEGPGTGARFVLDLPLRPGEPALERKAA